MLVPMTTVDDGEQRCGECHGEGEELRVEVVHHEEPANPHRERHEEVENEGLIAGRLFMSIRKWPWEGARPRVSKKDRPRAGGVLQLYHF